MPILDKEFGVLSRQCSVVIEALLESCARSEGDLSSAEQALANAVLSLRSILVSSATRVCVSVAAHDYYCPDCGSALAGWGTTDRCIVTSSGEGTFPSERYRCRVCRTDHYPWQVAQGLDEKNQFTLSARELIAQEVADAPFGDASERLKRMGLVVSASEASRIGCEVAQWRKQEQEVVRSSSCRGDKALSVPLHDWSNWPAITSADQVVVFSADGAKARSTEVGPKGLEWFEVRSGIIRLAGDDHRHSRKICVGGILEPDKLFETMRSQWWQAPASWHERGPQRPRTVFVADGAEWIWDRAGWYFPHCVQILDIYHAAQHVGSAARAAWGADHRHARLWADIAIPWLLEVGGATGIICALVGVLRSGRAVDPDELRKEIRYFWRHRHRMRYHRWKAEGLPIGSGAMESTIKQLSTQRLRRAGMKWTRANADLMVHLRAATLSKALTLTIERERRIRANRALKFNKPTQGLAIAV